MYLRHHYWKENLYGMVKIGGNHYLDNNSKNSYILVKLIFQYFPLTQTCFFLYSLQNRKMPFDEILNSNQQCLFCSTASLQNKDSKKPPEENKEDSVQLPPKAAKKSESVLCESCGDTFKSRDYLKTHVDIKHNNQTVACSICNAKFAAKHSLKRHIKRVHGTKNFICSTCGKGFAYETHLSKHVKVVHEKLTIVNKNKKCRFCDRKYFDKKSLTIHERSVHTGEF